MALNKFTTGWDVIIGSTDQFSGVYDVAFQKSVIRANHFETNCRCNKA